MSDHLLAGFGKTDITPQTDGTFKILDPIYFRALHLKQGEKQVTFLSADLFQLDDDFKDLVAKKVADIEIDGDWILQAPSHLGTAPIFFNHYMVQPTESLRHYDKVEFYAEAAAQAIRFAYRDVSPTSIAVGTTETPEELAHNRRAYDKNGNFVFVTMQKWHTQPSHLVYKPHDRQLGIVYIKREKKRPITLINYANHALCLVKEFGNISGEYCGRLCQMMDAEGVDALFIQGALGDIAPNRKTDDPANYLANALLKIAHQLIDTLEPTADVEIKLASKTIDIPFQPLPSPDELKQKMEKIRLSDGQNPMVRNSEGTWQWKDKDKIGPRDNHDRYKYWLASRFAGQKNYPYTLRAITLGSSCLLFIPGEPFSETASKIREAAIQEEVLILASPSAEAGYLATPLAHKEGANEHDLSALDYESEPAIVTAAIELINHPTLV